MGSLDEHFFRREYGTLAATLTRRFGVERFADIEDAVHSALLAAVESWPRSGVPSNPQGLLFLVAYNQLLGELRQRIRHIRILERTTGDCVTTTDDAFDLGTTEDVNRDLLRMLFACCNESIPPASQLVFALKTLAGFDIDEIARRLFVTEASV